MPECMSGDRLYRSPWLKTRKASIRSPSAVKGYKTFAQVRTCFLKTGYFLTVVISAIYSPPEQLGVE